MHGRGPGIILQLQAFVCLFVCLRVAGVCGGALHTRPEASHREGTGKRDGGEVSLFIFSMRAAEYVRLRDALEKRLGIHSLKYIMGSWMACPQIQMTIFKIPNGWFSLQATMMISRSVLSILGDSIRRFCDTDGEVLVNSSSLMWILSPCERLCGAQGFPMIPSSPRCSDIPNVQETVVRSKMTRLQSALVR